MPDVPDPGFSDAVMEPGATPVGHEGKCGGQLKQPKADGRTTCDLAAGYDTPHPGIGRCKFHGGSTPSHVIAAERVQAEQAVLRAQQTYGLPVDVEPGEALLGLVRVAAGVVAWLGAQVAQLKLDDLTADGRTHPLVALYLDERKHLAQVAKDTLAAGVAERRVRLEEAQGQLLVALLERVIRRLGKDPMDPEVREMVREELTAIEGGQAA
jgi:hypothetical protein